MESNNSGNSNNAPPRNVKIKVEPGTSMPVPLKNIKTEPGLMPSTTRLTSFRLPRDLTLGGNIKTEKVKKVYTPNLNTQRTKRQEDVTQDDSAKASRDRGNNRGRGRGERGRGRGNSNLIQSSGIWSTGITKVPGKRYSSGSRDSDRSSTTYLEKPKLEMKSNFDKADEEEKVKLLIRDDFIDDGEPIDIDKTPIKLPMIKEERLWKEEVKVKVEDEEEVDVKPILSENGEVIQQKKKFKLKFDKETKRDFLSDISKMVDESKSHSYILAHFPDVLPAIVTSADDAMPSQSSNVNSEKDNENKVQSEYCTLNNLKSGQIGKLQIMRSGKARLLFEDKNLIADIGTRVNFRQELIMAKIDTENLKGDLINLGPVTSSIIFSPDWERMLNEL